MIQKTLKGFSAKIIADSVSPNGDRLTTAELIFPRFILSEFNTHRMLSKNSASSRAIPVVKQIERIYKGGYIPDRIGVNQPGMQATRFLEGEELAIAQKNMHRKKSRALVGALEDLMGHNYVKTQFGDRYFAIMEDGFSYVDDKAFQQLLLHYKVTNLRKKEDANYKPAQEFLDIHKQTVNRYLEPFMFHTVVVSGTDWSNFFALRIHTDAQPEIARPAALLKDAMKESTPVELDFGEYHLPFIQPDEVEAAKADPEYWKYVAVGRCARTSYETHDGIRDPEKDYDLASKRLAPHGHMSPFEHIATPGDHDVYSGNFRGWNQFRKTLPYEDDYAVKLAGSVELR